MSDSLDFEALERLKNYLSGIRRSHVATMNHYVSGDGKGFWHQPSRRSRASLSSTATCVLSLVHAGLWHHKDRTWGKSIDLAARLLETPWESAGLDKDNPFSLSFIAEGVLDLAQVDAYPGCNDHLTIIKDEIAPLLKTEIASPTGPFAVPGSVSIRPYPPSAYLTHLAFRVLQRCTKIGVVLETELVRLIRNWARSEIHRQVALISTQSRIADPLQLAYAIILFVNASADEQTSPEDKALVRGALKIFFQEQQPDGGWRPSQPLFHYPDVGDARCFEYELFPRVIDCEPLQEELLQYLPQLELTAQRLKHSSFDLGPAKGGNAVGWASGHHPQIQGPESWSTACVYDFAHSLDRLVAEAIRRALFAELRSVYTPPGRASQVVKSPEDFAPHFLDAHLKVDGQNVSLKATIRDYFVLPIAAEKADVANGGSLRSTTPMSAILFGPPGTSKTQLAKLISQFLDWPLLAVDPSYLVQDGIDRLYARANRLFSMLAMTEQVVVLLDEFDEMGRDRAQSPDILSRFITTSMLPKLAAINEQRKLVFLLATNYVSNFDAAFSRGGRFDMIVQVMPPTLEAKRSWPDWSATLAAALRQVPDRKLSEAEEHLRRLTFLEMQQLVFRLKDPVEDVLEELASADHRGTLSRDNFNKKSWAQTSEEDEGHVRLPAVRPPTPATGGALPRPT